MINKNIVRHRLKAARLNAGLDKTAAARLIGVELRKRAIWEWEEGIYMPSLQMFIALCKAYGVTPDYICGYSDDEGTPTRRNNKVTLSFSERGGRYLLTRRSSENAN